MKKVLLFFGLLVALCGTTIAQDFLTVVAVEATSVTFAVNPAYTIRDIMGNPIADVSDTTNVKTIAFVGRDPNDLFVTVTLSDEIPVTEFLGDNPVTHIKVSGLVSDSTYHIQTWFYGPWQNTVGYSELHAVTTAHASVGLEEQTTEKINAFPNPVTDMLTISGFASVAEIKILDLSGKTVLLQSLEGKQDQVQLNLSSLSTGMYLVAVGGEVKKILKQ